MRHLILLVAFVAIPAYSQTAGAVAGNIGVNGITTFNGNMRVSSRASNVEVTFTYSVPEDAAIFIFTGAPYSGRTVTHTVRTLANGTHLTQQPFEQPIQYCDSMGRTRTETRMMQPGLASLPEIEDPVAGYRIVLDPVHRIAHRIAVQVRQNRTPNVNAAVAAAPVTSTRQDGATVTNEDLGTQKIFGVPAIGHRTTTTYPVGTYQGNDQPVTMVNETWFSPRYDLMLKSSNTGPDYDTTMTMEDFSNAEPDPSLFTIPAGYQIVDETGEFTVTIPRNAQ